jgi:2-polyprenyl-6-methoxyphenol hydroxylase-like FAD-dependent oxidoreductase
MQRGVKIKFNSTVVSMGQIRPEVHLLKDGSEIEADLIIGADGQFREDEVFQWNALSR